MNTITLTEFGDYTPFSFYASEIGDATRGFTIELGEILTELFVSDTVFMQHIRVAEEQLRTGDVLTHEEVFGTE